MPQKSKYDAADKERAVLDYLNGMKGCARIAQELGICSKTLKRWAALYKGGGIAALTPSNKDKYYPAVLKKQVVEEYLGGQVSIFELIAKYKISDNHVVTKWIAQYNNHVEFKSKQAGSEIYMAKGRPTTFEERQEIVDYCIAHEKGYRSAMEKYGVSYAQVYSWVKKFEQEGVNGLQDRRSVRKQDGELTENERLKAENECLKRINYNLQMENDVIKKLNEVKGRRG